MNSLFIGGTGRSGTTLFLKLLDSHPELLVFPEELRFFSEIRRNISITDNDVISKTLEHITSRLGGYGFYSDKSDYYSRLLEEAFRNSGGGHRDLFISIFQAYSILTNQVGKEYYVEKTPGNEKHWKVIKKWFPKSKFIILKRDPRAIYTSMQNIERAGNRSSSPISAEHFSVTLAEKYQHYKVLEENFPLKVIQYEDLVRNPREVMLDCCAFLNINWSDSLLKPTTNGVGWSANSSFGNNLELVNENSLNIWKDYLSINEEKHLLNQLSLNGIQIEQQARD